jgi:hypothetical protein
VRHCRGGKGNILLIIAKEFGKDRSPSLAYFIHKLYLESSLSSLPYPVLRSHSTFGRVLLGT